MTSRLTSRKRTKNNNFQKIWGVMEELTMFYSNNSNFVKTDKSKWLISGTATWKIIWDLYILFILLAICTIIPYRLAFDDRDTLGWIMTYAAIDICFFLDIIISFFTTFTDEMTY